ncbi:MAG: hypothetical protein ABIG87_00930 [Patescibacteria group bacterium]
METSFIPKKNYNKPSAKSSFTGLFMIVAMAIFLVAVASAVAVFFYNEYLISEIGNKSVILGKEKDGFDVSLIQKISKFDSRVKYAKKILDNHISLVPLFNFLENNTLKTISFSNFVFDINKDDITCRLDGVAGSYASVALQSDIFGKNKNIIEPIFSNLGVNYEGDITFSVSAKIDPRLVSFKENIK